jgi:two-component system, NarL family, sensor histidine kinase DesK
VAVTRRGLGVEGLIRAASVGSVAASVAFATVAVAQHASEGIPRALPLAVGATVLALALHVRHLRYALIPRRAPAAGWTFAAMAVVVIGATPFTGPLFWVQMFHVVAASAFLVLRRRWAIPTYFALAALAATWTLAVEWRADLERGVDKDVVGFAAWHGLQVLNRGLAPIVLVWLVLALRNVEAMRHAIANQAVDRERRRIADEFHRSVGEALERLVAQSDRVAEHVATDPARARRQLESLVSESRRTLAGARQLLRRPSPTARAELEATVTILRAAGVDVTVELHGPAPRTPLDEPARAVLRRLTTDLLRTGSRGRVVVTLVADNGAQRIDYRTELVPALHEVSA